MCGFACDARQQRPPATPASDACQRCPPTTPASDARQRRPPAPWPGSKPMGDARGGPFRSREQPRNATAVFARPRNTALLPPCGVLVERSLRGAFAAIAQQHCALQPRTAPTPTPRVRDQKPAAWHSKATEKPAFRAALISFMRRRQPASLVIGELNSFGCRIRKPWGELVLVTKQKENDTKEGLLGSLRGECSRRRNHTIVRLRLAKVNVALLSLSASAHGRRHH